jgi:hypothetical protein
MVRFFLPIQRRRAADRFIHSGGRRRLLAGDGTELLKNILKGLTPPGLEARYVRSEIMSWTPEQLARVDAAHELEIAVRRADGTLRTWTPIWVVHVVGDVYVRTWYRRDTGWFGLALSTRRARVRVPGIEVDVHIEDVGGGPSGLREDVDDAYRDKYGGGSTGNMVGDEAAATTLRLLRE